MFMFSSEKDRLYGEIDTLRKRTHQLEKTVEQMQKAIWESAGFIFPYGSTKDGQPRAKPGRKPK